MCQNTMLRFSGCRRTGQICKLGGRSSPTRFSHHRSLACSSSVSNVDLARPQGPAHVFTRRPALPSRKSTTRSHTPSPVRNQQMREPDSLVDRAPTPNNGPGTTKSTSRHRSDSVATSASAGASGAAKRVTGWVSSVGRSRKNSLNKKNFQSLEDDDSDAILRRPSGDGNGYSSEQSASESLKRPTPSRPASVRTRRPPPPPVGVSSRPPSVSSTNSRKGRSKIRTVQAIYDFHGTAVGELAFEKGDVIKLLEDDPPGGSTDGWVKGELKGRIGLIPFNYTREIFVPPVDRRRTSRIVTNKDDLAKFDPYSDDESDNRGEGDDDDERKSLAASRTPFDDDHVDQEQSHFPPPNPKSISSPELILRREHLNASTSTSPGVYEDVYRQHQTHKHQRTYKYQTEMYSPTNDSFGFGDSDGGESGQGAPQDEDGLLHDSPAPPRPSMTHRHLSSIITSKKPPPPPPAARRTQTSVGGTHSNDSGKATPSQRPPAPPRSVRKQGSYDSFKSPFDA